LHELGIAQNIVESAMDEAAKAGARRVVSIEIDVGELMQLEIPVLENALAALMVDPRLRGAQVTVRSVPAKFSCNRCGSEWGMDEARQQLGLVAENLRVQEPDSVELPLHFLPSLFPVFLKCPSCGTADTKALDGESIVVRRMVME
jgi:hydrogenase nickel incorporation protein HypA/HybF